jgi:hypothetical protein
MKSILKYYRNCYYALMCIGYSIIQFSLTSDEYNIWNSAGFALTLFTLIEGTFFWYLFILIVDQFSLSSKSLDMFPVIFVFILIFNYFFAVR